MCSSPKLVAGRHAAGLQHAHLVGGNGVQRVHVATIDPDGTVTQDRFDYDRRNDIEGWALWSPDGTRFVLNVSPADAEPWRVAVANSDGTVR
jgi:hypothetical protein